MILTETQMEAINSDAAAFQIVACAGSGKTEVLARRVVRRMRDGVPVENIVAFTFTEKAAAELKQRIEQRAAEADERFAALPPGTAGLFVGTIHGYCLQMLQRCGGVYELFDPLPEEREWALLHRFGRRLGLVELMSQTWPNESVSVRRGVELFARSLAVAHNERLCRDTLKSCVPAFAQAVERYEDLLSGMQLLSFDGMVEAACNELAPGGKLRRMLEGRITEVFVDEYQDLNRAQEELLGHLVEMGARLTVVGDDDQAIYQWRGGDISIFLDFNSRFDGARRKTLGDNHRSVEPIVTISAKFLSTIKRRYDKPIAAKRDEAQPAIELLPAETPENEADLIVQRIRSLLTDGHKPGDVAVLYRSVRSSAKPLIDALRRNDIPAAAVGRLSLLDRPEMALVARIFVLWGGGTWYPEEEREVVTPDLLARDMADLTSRGLTETTRIVTELEHMGRQFAAKGLPDLMTAYMKILDMVGIPISGLERSRQEHGLGQLSELLTDFEHAQRRATPPKWYQQTVASAAEEVAEDKVLLVEFTAPGAQPVAVPNYAPGEIYLRRLRVFLEQFASSAVEESPDSPALQKDAINIMTIHKSKGLEFPIIFVPSLVERRFPSARMGQEQRWYVPKDLFDKARYQGREDDERRLFYVALTRARDLLVLSWFGRYASGTSTDYSPFIRDLVHVAPRDYLRRAGQCRPPISPKPPISRPTIETNFGELYTFHECPHKYYLRHVCGFQPPLDPALNFGKLLHHGVAELARRAVTGQSVTPSDVDEIVPPNCYLPFAGRQVRERLYKSAKRRLTHYVRNFGNELARTISPERKFEVPINSARVVGRIDLLLRAEGGGPKDVELIDFKTAANRPPSENHKSQLRLYAEAARILGLNPVRLIIHDLDADAPGRSPVEEDDIAKSQFKSQLHGWITGISAGQFERKRNKRDCVSCDFAQLCTRQPG